MTHPDSMRKLPQIEEMAGSTSETQLHRLEPGLTSSGLMRGMRWRAGPRSPLETSHLMTYLCAFCWEGHSEKPAIETTAERGHS